MTLIAFAAGLLLIAAGYTYAAWVALRVARLRSDLLDIRDEALTLKSTAEGDSGAAFIEFANRVEFIARHADVINVGVLLVPLPTAMGVASDQQAKPSGGPALERLMDRYCGLLADYINQRTLGGGLRFRYHVVRRLWRLAGEQVEAEERMNRREGYGGIAAAMNRLAGV